MSDNLMKVFMFGDSICNGYMYYVRDSLLNCIDVIILEENAKYTTNIRRSLREWKKWLQGINISYVMFNVGLWDILRLDGADVLVSPTEYKRNLELIIRDLKYFFPTSQIIFNNITPINEELQEDDFLRLNSDVYAYNQIAENVMKKNGCLVNDLFMIAVKRCKNYYVDGTHFSEEGYQILGNQISQYLKQIGK